MQKKLFYLAGLVAGDGYLEPARNRIDIRAKSPEFLSEILKLFLEYNPQKDQKHMRIRITSKKLYKILEKEFEISSGRKSHIIKIPSTVFYASKESQSEYIAGWYDAEGWLEKDNRYSPPYKRIRFCVISEKVVIGLNELLCKFGFKPTLFNSGKRRCLDLNGKNNVDLFFKSIPVKHIKWMSALA